MKTYIYTTAVDTARALIERLIRLMNEDENKIYHFAFSGGSTPSLMFDLWANEYKESTPWERMRVFWVDERCVPCDDSESNCGTMRRLLLDHVPISKESIFPIDGTNIPAEEAKRYSNVVCGKVPLWRNRPFFDAVMLGAGEDGHTSSIFPGQEHLLASTEPYEASRNPYNGQWRIAMTGNALFNAKKLIFLITGKSKMNVVHDITVSGDMGPAAYVAHHAWNVELFLDDLAVGSDGKI